MIEIELPFPPSTNHYWRRAGRRIHIAANAKRFTEQVDAIVAEMGFPTFTGVLAVEVELYPPDARKRDTDNSLKAILDALQKAGAFVNDNQVRDIKVSRRDIVKGGRALIRILEVGS